MFFSKDSGQNFHLKLYLQHLGSCHDDLLLAIGTKMKTEVMGQVCVRDFSLCTPESTVGGSVSPSI